MVKVEQKTTICQRLFYLLDLIEVLIGKDSKDFSLIRSRILDLANDIKRMDTDGI